MHYKNILNFIHEHIGQRLSVECLLNLCGGYENILHITLYFLIKFLFIYFVNMSVGLCVHMYTS